MANKQCKIPYFVVLIVTFAVLIAGVIVTALCGINLGFKEAGGTQVRIDLNSVISSQAKVAAEDVFADNDVVIDSMFIEDKGTTSYFVINVADKSIENLDTIKAELASKLGIETTSISSVVVKSTIKDNVYLTIGLVLIGLILAVAIFGAIRYRAAGSAALGFGFLVQIMLPLSIVFCTRIQLSLGGIIAIIVLALILTLIACIMLEKYRAQTKGKDLKDGDEKAIMADAIKSTMEPTLFVIGGLFILAIATICIGVHTALMLALTIIVSLLTFAFNTFLLVPKTNVALGEISRVRLEAHLSKDNSPAPKKDKTKKKK